MHIYICASTNPSIIDLIFLRYSLITKHIIKTKKKIKNKNAKTQKIYHMYNDRKLSTVI